MAEEHRQEMERENRKLSAMDLARLQERVRFLGCCCQDFFTGVNCDVVLSGFFSFKGYEGVTQL